MSLPARNFGIVRERNEAKDRGIIFTNGRSSPRDVPAGDSDRMRCLDRHARRNLSRAAGLLRVAQPDVPGLVPTEIFLRVYVRVLLQSLRYDRVPGDHRVQAAVPGLARIPDRIFRARVGRQHLYERLRPAAARLEEP